MAPIILFIRLLFNCWDLIVGMCWDGLLGIYKDVSTFLYHLPFLPPLIEIYSFHILTNRGRYNIYNILIYKNLRPFQGHPGFSLVIRLSCGDRASVP